MSSREELAEARLLGYKEGYYEGVQAAREAVAGLEYDGDYCKVVHSCDALAAIDALKEQR